jgi:protein phosphatase
VRLRVGACTSPGRQRPENQDFLLYRIPMPEPDAERHCSLFVAADGVGGAVGGAVASKLAADEVARTVPRNGGPDPAATLATAARAANEAVAARAAEDRSLKGMATTLVAGIVREGLVWLVNVGDSRAYLVRGGEAAQVTLDHSLVAEAVRGGSLSEAEAESSPYRHVITRSLGHEAVEPDTFGPLPLQLGDRLLLCTDGLTETMSADDIAAVAAHGDVNEAARALVDEANRRGGPDNISVLLVAVV